MSQTRREFLVQTAGLLSVATVAGPTAQQADRADPQLSVGDPGWIVGDPYTATACAAGFGARSFDAARQHALRFRAPDEERDRQALGVEA